MWPLTFNKYPIKLFYLGISYGHCFTSFIDMFYLGKWVIRFSVRRFDCISKLFRFFSICGLENGLVTSLNHFLNSIPLKSSRTELGTLLIC